MYEIQFEKENEDEKLKEARNAKLKEISLNSTETREVDRFSARYYALLHNFPRGRDTFGANMRVHIYYFIGFIENKELELLDFFPGVWSLLSREKEFYSTATIEKIKITDVPNGGNIFLIKKRVAQSLRFVRNVEISFPATINLHTYDTLASGTAR